MLIIQSRDYIHIGLGWIEIEGEIFIPDGSKFFFIFFSLARADIIFMS